MFPIQQKREIADKVQKFLRETNHPELPEGEINFHLHVEGADPSWSWADIKNNGAVPNPSVNPWNELQSKRYNIKKYRVLLVIPYCIWDKVEADSEEDAISQCDYPDEFDLNEKHVWFAEEIKDDEGKIIRTVESAITKPASAFATIGDNRIERKHLI
ncbi:MAG: hypothetical protein Q8M94_19460 [Ignavibacteria bacterium]|nr:hypothetical protein [Ignavibacteria bacterium]